MTTQAVDRPKQTTDWSYKPFMGVEAIKLSPQVVRSTLVKPTKKGHMPTEADVMRFIMLCRARGLNPFEGDAFLVGYDGQGGPEFSLITAHQAFMKRAEANREYDGMISGVITQNPDGDIVDLAGAFIPRGYALLGGWATVYRKDQSHQKPSRLNLEARKKDNRFWNQDTGGMIVKCAEADALRDAFPNSLAGMYLAEELVVDASQFAPALPEPQSNGTRTERLADKIGAGTETRCDGKHEAPACERHCWRVEELGEEWAESE